MQKYGQCCCFFLFFSHRWTSNMKAVTTTKLVQMISSAWFGLLFLFIYLFIYLFFGHLVEHSGSWIPTQGSNSCSPALKCGVLTLDLQGSLDLGILSMSVISREVLHWLFSVNVSIWLLSVSADLLDHGSLSNEKSLAWNLQTTFDVFSQSQHLDTLHNFFFFCFSACFYLSWNNKAWYTKNVACFLPSLILK